LGSLGDPSLSYVSAWRRQFLSLFADFASWLYLGYAAFSLHYLYTSPILVWRPEEKFVLPALSLWGWILVVLVALELALVARSFGLSVGLRAVGCTMVASDGHPPRVSERVRHFLAAQVSLLPLGIGVWLSPTHPWHERLSGVRLVPLGAATIARRPWYRRQFGVMGLVLLGMTVALGWRVTGINLQRMVRDAARPMRMWHGLSHPDFRYFIRPDPGLGQSVVGGLVESLFMALLATVFGALIAFPLSFLGARNLTAKGPLGTLVYGVTRVVFNVFRSVESIFWAAIFAIWVGWGPFAGSVALMIHTIAALGKLYSEQVEHIDPGPLEAVEAAGASRLEVMRYAVVPQIIPPFLAFTFYRWDINLRMATVVALVGGGGIGRLFFWYKDDLQWHFVGAVVVGFAAVVWALDYVSGWVREKIT
jgi:phosphonate transport system permease protein